MTRSREKANKMNQYTFFKGKADITIEAANYAEALAALIFEVGSESDAAEWIYRGDE